MASSSATEYATFYEKVKRTIYLDNLSTHVTDVILRSAISQFGTVKSVKFIPNYNNMKMQYALVEMENAKQVTAVYSSLEEYPFMIGGMPRPVRALPAVPQMLEDRPMRAGRNLQIRWLKRSDPDFAVGQNLKQAIRRHNSEAASVIKLQTQEDEKISKHQEEHLKANYKKFEQLDNIMSNNGAAPRLMRIYGMPICDR